MFKEIPGTAGFTVDTLGVVKDNEGIIRPQYVNGSGYKTVAIKTPSGKWVTVGVHRCIALAWLPNNRPDRNDVNHTDGDRINNRLSNLDWCTPYENEVHKAVLTGTYSNPKVIIRNTDNGSETYFANLYEAAGFLQISLNEAWDLMKESEPRGDKLLVPRLGMGVLYSRIREEIGIRSRDQTPIDMYDVRTMEKTIFANPREAAKFFGVRTNRVIQGLSTNEKFRLFQRHYIVIKGGIDPPEFDEEDVKRSQRMLGKPVSAQKDGESQSRVFQSARDFIEFTGLGRKTVTTMLKEGKVRVVDGWTFKYV